MLSRRRGVLFIAVACLALATPAAAQSLDSLMERSPFFPEGYDPNPRPPQQEERREAPPADWEFRGWVTMNGTTRVSLFNKTENTSTWANVDNSGNAPVEVISFDPGSRTLQIRAAGRIQSLEIEDASFSAEAPNARPAPPQRRNREAANDGEDEDDRIIRRPIRRRVIVPRRRDNN